MKREPALGPRLTTTAAEPLGSCSDSDAVAGLSGVAGARGLGSIVGSERGGGFVIDMIRFVGVLAGHVMFLALACVGTVCDEPCTACALSGAG